MKKNEENAQAPFLFLVENLIMRHYIWEAIICLVVIYRSLPSSQFYSFL